MATSFSALVRRTYYNVKPFLPRSLRWALRRRWAAEVRSEHSDVWPIDPSSGGAPAGWPGWPDGKRFAFVLTHDVEGPAGVELVRKLAGIERERGLRSSFNFIPEGEYSVEPSLREWLESAGFEVGVHDLHHNGKLYRSRRGFQRNATRINGYLEQWGACGFRSGFMLRQLDWLHDLDIDYDASTFDTDPFEPQPEGSRTIFPFVVPHPEGDARRGYVELPYTLPQDSTLYLLLGEESPEIWLHKLDWIAKRGGMALVNIHPDYIDFGTGSTDDLRYSVQILVEFLDEVVRRHGGEFWNPLPRELAAWFRQQADPFPARTEA